MLQLVWVFLYNIWTLIVRSWHKWHTDVPLCLPTSKFKDTGTPEVHYFFLDAPIGSNLLNIDIIYIFLIGRSVKGPLSKLCFSQIFSPLHFFQFADLACHCAVLSICKSCMTLCCVVKMYWKPTDQLSVSQPLWAWVAPTNKYEIKWNMKHVNYYNWHCLGASIRCFHRVTKTELYRVLKWINS